MLTVAESQVVGPIAGKIAEVALPSERTFLVEAGEYGVRLAVTQRDRLDAYRLRFVVFNLELHEGLMSAYADGLDRDQFDDVCEHLLVEDKRDGRIVGTYRLQRGEVAGRSFGYYSEQEFGFVPYEGMRGQIVELGRACIHREHRAPEVLHLLWRGIARYALAHGGRYMMGCCSLTSQDAEMGWAVYASLQHCLVEPELRTVPTAAYALPACESTELVERAPKLLRAYLTLGARICGPPAIDREFGTIDFLTLLDLQALHPRMAAKFLEGC
ncbi:MAG: family N-acetyltransferase [Acidobacteriaceae bacterium]|nr:family N-acetyltransferase [Acidobacteriaceae bacterium]